MCSLQREVTVFSTHTHTHLPPPPQTAAPKRTALRVQSLRVVNVEIPNSKRIEFSLQYIYGIGSPTAQDIIRETVGAVPVLQAEREYTATS